MAWVKSYNYFSATKIDIEAGFIIYTFSYLMHFVFIDVRDIFVHCHNCKWVATAQPWRTDQSLHSTPTSIWPRGQMSFFVVYNYLSLLYHFVNSRYCNSMNLNKSVIFSSTDFSAIFFLIKWQSISYVLYVVVDLCFSKTIFAASGCTWTQSNVVHWCQSRWFIWNTWPFWYILYIYV